jgi:molecular chaperone GrpE
MQEDPSVDAGKVLQEYQKGYVLNDRLIRPALVVVNREANGGGGPAPSEKACESNG